MGRLMGRHAARGTSHGYDPWNKLPPGVRVGVKVWVVRSPTGYPMGRPFELPTVHHMGRRVGHPIG